MLSSIRGQVKNEYLMLPSQLRLIKNMEKCKRHNFNRENHLGVDNGHVYRNSINSSFFNFNKAIHPSIHHRGPTRSELYLIDYIYTLKSVHKNQFPQNCHLKIVSYKRCSQMELIILSKTVLICI